MTKILYFGTTEFSARVLEALVHPPESPLKGGVSFEVVGVVTQPDRPVGRTQEVVAPPVKIIAERLGLPVWQPESLKNFIAPGPYDLAQGRPERQPRGGGSHPPARHRLRRRRMPGGQGVAGGPTPLTGGILPQADIFVVFAYGLLIPKAILQLPPHGTINIHPSLLPKYRGPTPVQTAIINGDTETGVSIMLLDEQMDHGLILKQLKMPIDQDDTTDTLTDKLITAATPLLIQTIQDWVNKKITPIPQDDLQATYCKKLVRDDGRVGWSKSAPEIYNLYRGLTSWPGIWTTWEGKRLKLLKIKKASDMPDNNRTIEQLNNIPGKISVLEDKIYVECCNDFIEVAELQLEGKKAISAEEFIRGYKNFAGSKLV